MTTKSTARAPRKTKIAEVIENGDAPVVEGLFRRNFNKVMDEAGVPGTSVKRYVAGLLVSLLSGYALGSYVVGPVLAAFTIGALMLSWPLLIILLGYVILMTFALYYGSAFCQYMGELVIAKRVDAMYFIARDKISNLFNFSKEVTA